MKSELERAFDLIERQTVTADVAASFLGYTKQGVIKLFKNGKLAGRQFGCHYRIVSRSLDEYAKSRTAKVSW